MITEQRKQEIRQEMRRVDRILKRLKGQPPLPGEQEATDAEVKDFIADRLGLPWEEFNRTAVAGFTTFERLSQMLNNACFAFVIMTAEDEHADAKWHARENVIHEVGLFQGRLGPKRAIVMLENGCQEFSNIHGLSQIRFPSGEVSAAFEEMRRVLEREGILKS